MISTEVSSLAAHNTRCLANRVMCLAHLPRLAAQRGGTRMYATLCNSFYWLTTAKDIYQFVVN
jgi:hypothetical protein